MKIIKKANFHTHTTFCDGHSTAEEMVQSAIAHNIDILGFSSHSMYPFSSSWHIPVNNVEAYCAEIRRLKEAYKDKIDIQLGFEADYIPNITSPDKKGDYKDFQPDFLIGSIHYIVKEGALSAQILQTSTPRAATGPHLIHVPTYTTTLKQNARCWKKATLTL